MNKRYLLLVFTISFILLPFASAMGMGMPPSKEFDAEIGKEFFIDIAVFNEEGSQGNYSIQFEGSLRDRAYAFPSSAIINPPLNVPHRGNTKEDGFEKFRVYVNSTGLTPGDYDLSVSASVMKTGSGALNIIQRVTRKITVHYEYPPSFFNIAMNFVYKIAKNILNFIANMLASFYKNNPWLNYLFAIIFVVLVFYVGTKVNKIIKTAKRVKFKVERNKEKIEKHGFWAWFIRKIKDTFKKTKKKEFVEITGKKDEEKREGAGNNKL